MKARGKVEVLHLTDSAHVDAVKAVSALARVAQIKYAPSFIVFIRFIGSHAEYDPDRRGKGLIVIQPISDETSHRKALRRAEQLWDAAPGSPGERELDALATLIDMYEQRTFPIDALSPIDATQLARGVRLRDQGHRADPR